MATHWVCSTCGVQFDATDEPPAACPICEDERQYVRPDGQQWTTVDELRESRTNEIVEVEENVWSVRTVPAFGIGQRAYLIRTSAGNVLWESITVVDPATIDWMRSLRGLCAIAISHPHYYSSMVGWSRAFGECPIWIHENDRQWVMRKAPQVRFWSGDTHPLLDGLTLVHCGGHFDGYQVLHWRDGANRSGALFAGDQPQVCMDRRWVTFMYSYPNWTPLGPRAVRSICERLDQLPFDRLYGAFGRNLLRDAKATIARSRERYLKAIEAPDS